MATDYEKFYRENKHGLGEPTNEFVTFFHFYNQERAMVLDVGCGQGRDAIFIAQLGHSVTAIDLSITGIRDLEADAKAENLAIETEVTDIRDYEPKVQFDVIVIDRTLHMLASQDRNDVLRKLLNASKNGSHILIADERSNIADFATLAEASTWNWTTTLQRGGFLLIHRQ